MTNNGIKKAQLTRELGVSRAYITMINNGERKPSKEIVSKIRAIYGDKIVNDRFGWSLTLNQPVGGSSAPRLTTKLSNRLIS